MKRIPVRQRLRPGIRAAVPSLAGWQSDARALVNLLSFTLVVLIATWVVHQGQYALEYGSRFGTVMGSTPHRFYMASFGFVLIGLAIVFLSGAIVAFQLAQYRFRRLFRLLPPRLTRSIHRPAAILTGRRIARTALVLGACQIVLYVVQENLEHLIAAGSLPGFWVLFASPHLTVIPLHLLAALCGSVLLWTISARLQRSRERVRLAHLLTDIIARRYHRAPRMAPRRTRLPSLRLRAGILCLRSPPLST